MIGAYVWCFFSVRSIRNVVNEVFGECTEWVRVRFFFSIFKAQAGCLSLSHPLVVCLCLNKRFLWEPQRWLMTSVFFMCSICDYVRMHAHSSIVFPIHFFLYFLIFVTREGWCLYCQHINAFHALPDGEWHRYGALSLIKCHTNVTQKSVSLWGVCAIYCNEHDSLEWNSKLCRSLTCCYQSNDEQLEQQQLPGIHFC